ncbi:hypothetical protein HanPSC8_Chr10g0430671 [Helianthus annuus]|nr:hypothetical protein HanPSC8_Chr10g0430671 [Helianthus annuus]
MKLIPIISAISIKVSLHCWITWIMHTIFTEVGIEWVCLLQCFYRTDTNARGFIPVSHWERLEEWMLCGEKLLE